MKKRFLALLLAMTMAMSVTAFARFDNKEFNYRKTTNVEAEAFGEQILVTWPAVDKSGNLINANPLASTSTYGNPTGGWTNPTKGMIIQYPNWNIAGNTTNPTQVATGEAKVLFGLTQEKTTDYPVVVKDAKTNEVVEQAYLSDEVVAKNFATQYNIYYSKDGSNWTLDHETKTINHGKKICRPQADGTYKDDSKVTFFLEDQLVDPLTATLDPGTKYYIKVVATNAANTKENFKEFTTDIITPAAAEKTPAFPTVEGGGTYSQGGRGTDSKPGDVYVVTSLDDSVSNPQPGTLRYGLLRKDRKDGNISYPRTIVFAVGGTINIDPTASKSNRRLTIADNTTVLGQTAPGEGITIAGASTKFNGENIIVRYLRVRLGDGYDQDAATATGKNIVIDHCTFNWGVDETFTAKELINTSIQYNIIANSLSIVNKNGDNNTDPELNSGESEAKHGMGSILNGFDTSFTHNLWANHGTRNPRFEGAFTYGGITYQNKVDFQNNVVFNWGHNSGYGGDRGSGNTNLINNYYKPGPNTLEKTKTRIFDCDGSGTSSWYVTGNYMYGSDEVTADNALGVKDFGTAGKKLSSPVELTIPYSAESATDAYNSVVNGVGASCFRDSVDAKLVNAVKSGESAFINTQTEEGGWQTPTVVSTLVDTDKDGMPDTWEDAMGLNKNDASDAGLIVNDPTKSYNGYSNIEVYANSLIGEWTEFSTKPTVTNTEISIDSINNGTDNVYVKSNDVQATLEAGKTYNVEYSYTSDAKDYNGQFELWINDQKVSDNQKSFTVPNTVGNYKLAIKATGTGNTLSQPVNIIIVPANTTGQNIEGFTSTDIGPVRTAGADYYDAQTGTLVTTGAGRVGILNTTSTEEPDAFHFNYVKAKGNIDFTAKVDNLAKIDYNQNSGLMIRKSLDTSSPFYMTSISFLKGEDYEGATDASGGAVRAKNIKAVYRNQAGDLVGYGNMLSIPQKRVSEEPNHGYMHINVNNGVVTLSASYDNVNWYTLNTFNIDWTDDYYVGFATDAAQDYMDLTRFNATKFADINLSTASSAVVGDADMNGSITADDAAATLQYVLTATGLSPQGVANVKAVLPKEDEITSVHAALILQNALDSTFILPQA